MNIKLRVVQMRHRHTGKQGNFLDCWAGMIVDEIAELFKDQRPGETLNAVRAVSTGQ